MSVRDQVVRGGAYLALRQALGTLVNVLGILLLARLLGPGQFGYYAAAAGVYAYLQIVSSWGIGVYLVRREGDSPDEVYHQASTLLAGLGVLGVLAGVAALPLIVGISRMPDLGPFALVLFLGLPLQLLASVPLARMERELNYRAVAWIELAAQAAFFTTAVPLAAGGLGAWAPIAGWWVQQLVLAMLYFRAARYVPRFHWSPALVRDAVGYGLSFSASIWIWQLRRLVNPFVVGRYLGAEVVGIVALAVQIVTHLSFIAVATWRLSTAALARVQTDLPRLARAVAEGMRLQVLGVGPPLVAFAWLAPWLLPRLFGENWAQLAVVFPFVALGFLASSAFNMQSSALYVLKRNWDVSLFHLVHIALFAVSALVLVPRLGMIGYGWAEVAALLSYAVLAARYHRAVGGADYAALLPLLAGFGVALFPKQFGWASAAPLLLVAMLPATRRQIGNLVGELKGLVYER